MDADDNEGHQKVAVRMIQKVRGEATTNMPFRFVCMYIRMYVCIYVCIYVVRDTHTHTHTHNYIGAGD